MTGLTLVATPVAPGSPAERTALPVLLGMLLLPPEAHLRKQRMELLPCAGPTPVVATRSVLPDLAFALADVLAERSRRRVVRLCVEPEPWELGVERAGSDVLVTVFGTGEAPQVALHERREDAAVLGRRLFAMLSSRVPANDVGLRPRAPEHEALFRDAAEALVAALAHLSSDDAGAPASWGSGAGRGALDAGIEAPIVSVEPTGEVPIQMSADISLRPQAQAEADATVQRADRFSLLFRGKLRVVVGGSPREIPDVFVFSFAEQLVAMGDELLAAWNARRSYNRRVTAGGALLGLKFDAEQGAAWLTLGAVRRAGSHAAPSWTFPALDVPALAQGIVAFGRALARSLVRQSRAFSNNLLVVRFRARVRDLSDQLRQSVRNDSKINTAAETYRAFAVASSPAKDGGPGFGQARLKYEARWTAAVASIDLRSTFLCGDVFVVGSARSLYGLDRRTGQVLWERSVPRAVSVMTPAGLARIEPDGTMRFYNIATGRAEWCTELAPRAGGSTSGAVVNAPRLPPMLIVSEGTRHLCAVDLSTGQVAWRYAARRGTLFRLKRAGKLVVVANGEPALTALDVVSGEVVWRFCERLPFASHVAVDHDALFALAGDGALVGRGGTRLFHLDPWSGECRWSVDLPKQWSPLGAPLIGAETVIVVGHGHRGTEVCAFDRKTGALRFERVACMTAASCLLVDQLVLVNSEGGELIALDAADGATRYRHVFGTVHDGDRPRRLEPVLRSGALFVPQNEVYVVRPADGTLLAQVHTDLVPDLLRVDERCDLYVAEESGHIASFAAGPRLTRVK